jgi:hypothetical protein
MPKEIRKQTRFNSFQMIINLKSASDESFLDLTKNEILQKMINSDFPTQQMLEEVMISASISSKNSNTDLSCYIGQLEMGKRHSRPHWQIFLQTSKQTNSKHVLEYFSRAIFNEDKNTGIQVIPVNDVESSKEYVTKDERLVLPESAWSPGTITKESAEFREELKNDKITMEIYSNPRIYQRYINNIIDGPSHDRLIHWVMDFGGCTGKSKYSAFLENSGKAIVVEIDNPRAFSKSIILQSTEYQKIYRKPPETIIVDLSRQVPLAYFDGFFAILESVKNKKVTSTFQYFSKFNWSTSPKIIIFANRPPIYDALSRDRFVLLEILNQDYSYAIRRAVCAPELVKHDTNLKCVCYRYKTRQATLEDVRKLTGLKGFQFSPEELEYEKIIKNNSSDLLKTVASFEGTSTLLFKMYNQVPPDILSLLMGIG